MIKRYIVSLLILLQLPAFSQSTSIVKKHRKIDKQRASERAFTNNNEKLNKMDQYRLTGQLDRELDTLTIAMKYFGQAHFEYNSANKISTEIKLTWSASNSIFVNDNKTETTYDAKGNATLVHNLNWDPGTKDWYNNYKDEYTFNTSNLPLEDVYSEWNDVKSSWNKISKIMWTYDANNRVSTDFYLVWDGSQFVNYDKIDYTYDAKGNKLTDKYSLWNSATSSWDLIDNYDRTYDTNNNLTRTLYLQWVMATSRWLNLSKDTFSYDGNKNMLTDIYSEWNVTKSSWVNVQREDNIYDSKANQTRNTISLWDARKLIWNPVSKTESSFNLSIPSSQLILPFDKDYSDFFFKTLCSAVNQFKFNAITSMWDTTNTTVYSYNKETVGIKNGEKQLDCKMYPNPAKELLSLELSSDQDQTDVSIYNTNGQLMFSSHFVRKTNIPLSGFAKGLYLLHLSGENGEKRSTKFLIN